MRLSSSWVNEACEITESTEMMDRFALLERFEALYLAGGES